jgi:hypothetical protein
MRDVFCCDMNEEWDYTISTGNFEIQVYGEVHKKTKSAERNLKYI